MNGKAGRMPASAIGAEGSVEAKLAELRRRLMEISDLGYAVAVLGWDQSTYMPPGGAFERGRQKALLNRLAHERLSDPAVGRLLDDLDAHFAARPGDGDGDVASLLGVTRRSFERALKVPADFVARRSAAGAAAYDAWIRARPANDFDAVVPHLEKAVALSREYAGYFAPSDSIVDPLIARYDEGMTAATVRSLFASLRAQLVPIAQAICDQPLVDDRCLKGPFDEARQLEFSMLAIKAIGYDTNRGRLDKTVHPFCTKFGHGDIRITTRVRLDDLGDALFSCLHEAGHGMYEQGVAAALVGTPLGHGASSGVHESQSRLWENIVGRSLGFWQHFYPALVAMFPDQLGAVPLETFYRAINKVQRSLIRTDADEVTYNLHVMLRFDIETDLIEGRLKVKDLPEAWRARMLADIGVAPPDHRDGCLQDVHWFGGMIGGNFQGYTIGNILGAQFHSAALAAHPEIPGEIARGEFGTLLAWLQQNIYRHGATFEPDDLVRRVTGGEMRIEPYIAYLRAKYGEIYRLPVGD
jgi:carboxypeptidase Taq